MTQPQAYFPQVVGGLENRHRAGMPQYMRKHPLPKESGTPLGRVSSVFAKNVLEPGTGQVLSPRIEEEFWHRGCAPQRWASTRAGPFPFAPGRGPERWVAVAVGDPAGRVPRVRRLGGPPQNTGGASPGLGSPVDLQAPEHPTGTASLVGS